MPLTPSQNPADQPIRYTLAEMDKKYGPWLHKTRRSGDLRRKTMSFGPKACKIMKIEDLVKIWFKITL